jgi:hypothetical protein
VWPLPSSFHNVFVCIYFTRTPSVFGTFS